MPTNPTTPASIAAVDRLALGVDSPRGTEPSLPPSCWTCPCACFETETSNYGDLGVGLCFEAEASVMCSCIITCNCFASES